MAVLGTCDSPTSAIQRGWLGATLHLPFSTPEAGRCGVSVVQGQQKPKRNSGDCKVLGSYLNPMKENWSHSQASVSIRSMVGNAKPNQEAKFRTSPFSGNNLPTRTARLVKGGRKCCPPPKKWPGIHHIGRENSRACLHSSWSGGSPLCLEHPHPMLRGSLIHSQAGVGCHKDTLLLLLLPPLKTHWFICPLRTRLGPVPVSVAVPPMLAA